MKIAPQIIVCSVLLWLPSCTKPETTEGALKQLAQLQSQLADTRSALETARATNAALQKRAVELQQGLERLEKGTEALEKARQEAEKSLAALKTLGEKPAEILAAMQSANADTEFTVADLKRRVGELESSTVRTGSVGVSVSEKGYSLLRTDMGPFPISLEKAEPYLDGHKLYFKIGNPLGVAVTGAKLSVVSGPRRPELPVTEDGQPNFDQQLVRKYLADKKEWAKRLKKTVVPVESDLASASWNTVEAIVVPSKPDEVAYLEVDMTSTGVIMSTPRR